MWPCWPSVRRTQYDMRCCGCVLQFKYLRGISPASNPCYCIKSKIILYNTCLNKLHRLHIFHVNLEPHPTYDRPAVCANLIKAVITLFKGQSCFENKLIWTCDLSLDIIYPFLYERPLIVLSSIFLSGANSNFLWPYFSSFIANKIGWQVKERLSLPMAKQEWTIKRCTKLQAVITCHRI